MPLGQRQSNMGIGLLGDHNLIIKRKYQWAMSFESTLPGCFSVPESFLKSAARPNISFEATELNFLNEKTYIPGKPTWEPITVTFIDVAGSYNQGLLSWLVSVYNFMDNNPNYTYMGSAPIDYTATGTIISYSGSGQELEKWTLKNCWPESINFGDLDMSSNEEMTIELSLRYTKATYEACGVAINPCGYKQC